LVNLRRGPGGIEHDPPVRLLLGFAQKAVANAAVKLQRLLVHPIALQSSGDADLGIEVEEKGQIRGQPPRGEVIPRSKRVSVKSAPVALIDHRRIGKAIRDHDRPLEERGPNQLIDVVRTICQKEKELGPGGQSRRLQQNLTQGVSGGGRSRLSGLDHFVAGLAERFGQTPLESRFPSPFGPFQGDEHRLALLVGDFPQDLLGRDSI